MKSRHIKLVQLASQAVADQAPRYEEKAISIRAKLPKHNGVLEFGSCVAVNCG